MSRAYLAGICLQKTISYHVTRNLLKLFFQTLLQGYTIKILLTLIRVFYDYFWTDNPDLHIGLCRLQFYSWRAEICYWLWVAYCLQVAISSSMTSWVAVRLLGWVSKIWLVLLGEMGSVWVRGVLIMTWGVIESTTVGEIALELARDVTERS